MKSLFAFIVSLSCFALAVLAQTVTTTDDDGNTIVEVITTNIAGIFTTETLETLALAATTPPTNPTTTIPPPQIVGQPAPTDESAPPTTFTFTTTDANGDTTALTAVFTPTFAPTVLPSPTATGTVLDVSQWLSIIGGTSAISTANSARPSAPDSRWLGIAASTVVGIVGGAWLALA